MKKFIMIALALAVLTMVGCANTEPKEVEETTVGQLEKNEDFTLSIAADNSVYKADEKITCDAILTYIGEEELTVLHSDPLVVFYIEDSELFSGGGTRQDSLNRTTFKQDEEMALDFVKSGGWSADDPNAAYYEAFYADEDLRLPAGEYTLSVQIMYATDENDMMGTMKTLVSSIDITVE